MDPAIETSPDETFTCPRCSDKNASVEHHKHCDWCERDVCTDCWHTGAELCFSCHEVTFVCEVCDHRYADDDHYTCEACDSWVCDNCYIDGPDMCSSCAQHQPAETIDATNPYVPNEHSPVFPWEQRGVFITVEHPAHPPSDDSANYPNWQACWPIDRRLDPITAAADFYLLELVCHPGLHVGVGGASDPDLQVLAEMARIIRADIVDTFDPVFIRYVDMVVGGELRHVGRVRANGLIRSPRPVAWMDWHSIRAQLGVTAGIDAAALFAPMTGSFGGAPWSQAAEIVASRLQGRITPEQFVDRVFCLEHNCGSLLNKLTWGLDDTLAASNRDFYTDTVTGPDGLLVMKYKQVETIKDEIGPAHASNPPILPVLVAHASLRARRLFSDWHRAVNKVRMRLRMEPLPQLAQFATLIEYRAAVALLSTSYIDQGNPVFAQVICYGPRWLYANDGEPAQWRVRYQKLVRHTLIRPPDYAWLVEFTNLIGTRPWDDNTDSPLLHALQQACRQLEARSTNASYVEGVPIWEQPTMKTRAHVVLEAARAHLTGRPVPQRLFVPPPRRMVFRPRVRPEFIPPADHQPELEF